MSDLRSTFYVSQGKGGFVRVHSREKLKKKQRIGSPNNYSDDEVTGGTSKNNKSNVTKSMEQRDSMMGRFRSLLVKQKQYTSACENSNKPTGVARLSPDMVKPVFDMDSMKDLINTIEDALKQDRNKSSMNHSRYAIAGHRSQTGSKRVKSRATNITLSY